jgi:hypothetical protein
METLFRIGRVTLLLGAFLAAMPARAQAPGRPVSADEAPEPDAEDRRAGLRGLAFPWRGSRAFSPVAGEVPAPGNGVVTRVRVEVEGGLDVDADVFAAFVLETLNDPRSWSHDGERTFSRTAGEADVTVTLASPATTIALCRPFDTGGILSCGQPGRAVLTMYRWVQGVVFFGADMTLYRQYVLNHEVGHVLGRDHQPCRRRGALAPVMHQQTKGLGGCRPNAWPYP